MEGFNGPPKKKASAEEEQPKLNRREFLAGAAALGGVVVTREGKAPEPEWANPDSIPNPDFGPEKIVGTMSAEEAKSAIQQVENIHAAFYNTGKAWFEAIGPNVPHVPNEESAASKAFHSILFIGKRFEDWRAMARNSIRLFDKRAYDSCARMLKENLTNLEAEVSKAEQIPDMQDFLERLRGIRQA